tara:strand:+ start:962 stop:2197 length:1236 start_codon:yes stop_codon:yes gene_type:complete
MIDFQFNRRDFMRVGGISAGLSAIGLSDIKAEDAPVCLSPNDKSVIWVWLGGGATQVETFDPKPDAPDNVRAVNGWIKTNAGYRIGADWENLATVGDKMTVVRSFAHGNASHRTGTHWVMTGYNSTDNTPLSPAYNPSYGSMVASSYGSNNPITGMPAYVRVNNITYDGGAWLGSDYKPYEATGEGVKNLQLKVDEKHFLGRQDLLTGLDRLRDNTSLRDQSYNMLLGNIADAFDVKKEDPKNLEEYGSGIGEQLLLARRLAERGTKFVTIQYGGWDMHSNISNSLKGRVPPVDKALTALIKDIHDKGLNKDIMVVVTGEFGRTYKINGNAGRDHWPRLSPLMISGGDFLMGYALGESTSKAEEPKTDPHNPQNLTATLLKHFGIDQHTQRLDMAGRPRYFLDVGTKSILV